PVAIWRTSVAARRPLPRSLRYSSGMRESRALAEARRCLARAEAAFGSADGCRELERGLDLVADVLAADSDRERAVAANLAESYRTRLYGRVDALAADASRPEPELEILLATLFAFDRAPGAHSAEARSLQFTLVRRLIDRYYEGYPASAKARALDELAALERHAGG